MKIYSYNLNSIVVYYNIDNLNVINQFLENNKNGGFIVYLYGNSHLKDISDISLKTIYLDDINDIKMYEKISDHLLHLDLKLNSLFLLQEYELLNTEAYILYEVSMLLEEAQKKKLDVNKIKTKLLEYLKRKNKIKLVKNIDKIKIYG